jgi:Leucine-rich repeat (LRR) protein
LESVEKLDGSGAVAEKVETLIIRSTSNGKVLEELTSRRLRKNFPNLKNLRVTCGLQSLDLAKSFPSLESVDIMDYNRREGERPLLKKIDFKRLTNLKTIRLKGCEKQWIRSWDFEHWDKLENFQLSRCQLESFDFSMSYPSLKRLDLDKTGISISENDVLDAPALTRLELENVDLSKVDLTKFLQKVTNLETVKFESNQLTTFPTEGLSFDKLKELEIRKQNLKALDLSKYNLENVEEMWIDKNPFESLKVPIAQMNKLEELEVKQTALKSYSLGSTKIPFALEELSVRKNKDLETLEVGALSTVYELNIKDNKNLKRITFANGIPVVNDEIDLKRNPKLECSCALVELLANVAPEGGRKKGIEIEGMCLNKDGKSVQVSDVSKENCVA